MRFIPEEYDEKCAMFVANEEQESQFREFLDKIGKTWCTGDRYASTPMLYARGDRQCFYYFNQGTWTSDIGGNYYGGEIVKFTDFSWDDDEFDTLHAEDADIDTFIDFFQEGCRCCLTPSSTT